MLLLIGSCYGWFPNWTTHGKKLIWYAKHQTHLFITLMEWLSVFALLELENLFFFNKVELGIKCEWHNDRLNIRREKLASKINAHEGDSEDWALGWCLIRFMSIRIWWNLVPRTSPLASGQTGVIKKLINLDLDTKKYFVLLSRP